MVLYGCVAGRVVGRACCSGRGGTTGSDGGACTVLLATPRALVSATVAACVSPSEVPTSRAQVVCGDAEVARKVEEKIAAFHAWAQRNPGKRGQVGAGQLALSRPAGGC